MGERKSKLTITDCTYLHRKMSEAQELILEFIALGCPEYGWRDDMMLCAALLELDKIIEDKVKVK